MNKVLHSTLPVVFNAKQVRINHEKAKALAQRLKLRDLDSALRWPSSLTLPGASDSETLNFLFILNALNFSFWPDKEEDRWEIEYQGRAYSGFYALAMAMRKSYELWVPITDFRHWVEIDEAGLAIKFWGKNEIPMLAERLRVARSVAGVMLKNYGGQAKNLVASANGSGLELAYRIADEFESFRDCALYNGSQVWFLKRAQIFVGDVWGYFGGQKSRHFNDINELTAFADYRVPQVLEYYGVLEYGPELKKKLRRRELLASGSEEEVEIRAVMIWAVELLKKELGLNAVQTDWLLWNEAQRLKKLNLFKLPHHRTRTVFY
jgi:hypothetical protein